MKKAYGDDGDEEFGNLTVSYFLFPGTSDVFLLLYLFFTVPVNKLFLIINNQRLLLFPLPLEDIANSPDFK